MAKIFIQHLKIIFLSSGARADAAIEPADPDVGGGECCQEEAETDQRRTRSGRSSWSPPARPRSSPCPLLVSSIPPPPQTRPKVEVKVEEVCHQEDLRPARGKVGRSPAGRKSTEKNISASTSAEKAATNKKSNNKKSQAANSDSSSDNSNSSSDSKSSDSDSNSDNENEISE